MPPPPPRMPSDMINMKEKTIKRENESCFMFRTTFLNNILTYLLRKGHPNRTITLKMLNLKYKENQRAKVVKNTL